MTRVSFYVLKESAGEPQRFACRLLERIHQQKQQVYAYVPDGHHQRQFDELLWTFSQGSFLPHDLDSIDNSSAIVIGAGAHLPAQREVMLNLDLASEQPPEFFSSFQRCVEIVAGSDAEKAAARQRYAYYRHRGYELETHNIG